MVQRRIVMLLAATALIVGVAGCAAQGTGAGSSLSGPAAAASTVASELSGTWRGEFYQVGGDSHVYGYLTLEIKDDATYRLTSMRRGAASNDSGVVVANGRNVTLKSSSGQWIPLMRNGNTLYGMTQYSTGHAFKLRVERAQ